MTRGPHAPLAAAILAAGLGQRLGGRPKATLRIGGRSLLERLVAAMREAGVEEVSVVVGPYRDQLLPLVEGCGARALLHPQPQASLVDSQRLALDAHLSRGVGADLLLVLSDLPLLGSEDVVPLLAAGRRRAPSVHAQMPRVGGVRGHPLLLSWEAVRRVGATRRHLGIRDWLARHPGLIASLPSERRAYVTDMDTPENLAALRALFHPEPVTWPASLGMSGGD